MHAMQQKSSFLAERIGQVVRQERERSEIRQDELALVAGVSTRVVHQIEHGKPTSRLDSLVSVLDALGLQLVVEEPSSRRSSAGEEQ
jgi:HTH-type transcriptional regulator / antitoxin HipB